VAFVAVAEPPGGGGAKAGVHAMSTTLTVDFFCSIDGYGMARGWPGYWGKEGPELLEDRVRTFAQDQVLVFGALESAVLDGRTHKLVYAPHLHQ
jgi:hypothetical protein